MLGLTLLGMLGVALLVLSFWLVVEVPPMAIIMLFGGLILTTVSVSIVAEESDTMTQRYCTAELALEADTVSYLSQNQECVRFIGEDNDTQ